MPDGSTSWKQSGVDVSGVVHSPISAPVINSYIAHLDEKGKLIIYKTEHIMSAGYELP